MCVVCACQSSFQRSAENGNGRTRQARLAHVPPLLSICFWEDGECVCVSVCLSLNVCPFHAFVHGLCLESAHIVTNLLQLPQVRFVLLEEFVSFLPQSNDGIRLWGRRICIDRLLGNLGRIGIDVLDRLWTRDRPLRDEWLRDRRVLCLERSRRLCSFIGKRHVWFFQVRSVNACSWMP